MSKLIRFLNIPVLVCFSLIQHASFAQDEVLSVEWVDLLSKADLEAIMNPPEMTHDGYGWQEQLKESGEGDAYLKAMQSVT